MTGRSLPYLLIAALTAITWANAIGNAPVWDDRIYLLGNPAVREGRWNEILAKPTGDYYRPAVFASFAIAGGGEPERFPWQIAGNVLLHAAAASLLFAAVSALGAPRRAALAAALVFALHPVQTEAVTYVSGRTDLLAALFSLAALLLQARARGWAGGRPRPGLALGAAACYALALGSKESSALLPLALLAGDRILARRPGGARALLPHAIVLAIYAAWRAHVGGGTVSLGDPAALGPRFLAALAAVGEYGRLVLLPVNLHLERFVQASAASALGGAAVLAAALVALARGSDATRFWILWAAIAYFPTSNLIPVYPGLPIGTIFAPEHFLYVPLSGIAACLVPALARRSPERPGAVLLAGALACFVLLARDRNRDWRDEDTLFRHTLRFSPGSARVRLNLGNLLLARGEPAGAAEQYAEGARREPGDADLLVNLGIARMRLGRVADAEDALLRATRVAPRDARAWATLGALYGNAQRREDARRAFERSLAIDPANPDARRGMEILNEVQR